MVIVKLQCIPTSKFYFFLFLFISNTCIPFTPTTPLTYKLKKYKLNYTWWSRFMTLLKIMHQTGMPILTIFGCKIYFLTLNFLKNNNFVNIPQYHQMQYNHTWPLANFIYRYPNQETEVTGIQMPNRTHT